MFGMRLIMLGILVLLGSGFYWLAMSRTDAEIETSAYIETRIYGADSLDATRAARASARTEQRTAIYPALLGVLLIGIGWAAKGKNAELSKTPDNTTRAQGTKASTKEKA